MRHGRRFVSSTLTNYELRDLRQDDGRLRVRQERIKRELWGWTFLWSGLSDPFHPRTLEEWQQYQNDKDNEQPV